MMKRAFCVACLVGLFLVAPWAQASPPSNTWCSNVCGPSVPCSTQCGAYSLLEGKWYWVDCNAYDTLFYGGGSCGLAMDSSTGDLDLDRFLASLESLAVDAVSTVIR